MFAKKNRFSFRKGVPKYSYQTPFFVVRYDKNDKDNFECSVVVGKKIDKKAVGRNKIKRQIVLIIKDIVPTTSALRMVIYIRKGLVGASKEVIEGELEKALIRLI